MEGSIAPKHAHFAIPWLLIFPLSLTGCMPALVATTSPRTAELASVAETYLSAQLFKPTFGGQLFCESEILDVEQQGKAIKVYLWVLCAEFYSQEEVLHMGTAVSEPLLVYMIEFQGRYLASGFAEPQNGERQPEDIRRMFPPQAIIRLCQGDTACSNARVERLLVEIERQVEELFKLPLATITIG